MSPASLPADCSGASWTYGTCCSVTTNVGSVALGAVAAVGYYLFTEVDMLDLRFDETMAGIVLATTALVHSAYWLVEPGFISMGLTVGLWAFIGTVIMVAVDW